MRVRACVCVCVCVKIELSTLKTSDLKAVERTVFIVPILHTGLDRKTCGLV